MVKISHEVPIQMLERSLTFNDYDYSLIHMLVDNEDYYNFYKTHSRGREQIMDNSAYELGDSFDVDVFAAYVEDIQPSHYIVPDKIGDYEATMAYFEYFEKTYDLPGLKIGVVQGRDEEEFLSCFAFMNAHCDKIAVPFHSPYYHCVAKGDTDYIRSKGRPMAINKAIEHCKGSIKPIHLLGCSLPQEFYSLNKYVESIDTSNPVIMGLSNINYTINDGYVTELTKPIGMIDYTAQFDTQQENTVYENISVFREHFITKEK